MRAVRYYGQKYIRVEEIDAPVAGEGEVLIDIAWCGICGTDLHEYLEGPIFCPAPGHPHPITGEEPPVTLGHEFSGVVAALGEGVDDLEVGQHVVVEPYVLPDDVDPKEPGPYNLHPDVNFIGLAGGGGGLSEKVAVQRRWVHPINNDVPLDEAALIEPLSVAHHAFVASEAKEGEVALIGGAGPIGVLTAAVAKAYGCTVVVSELSELRRQKALDAGVADYAIDPSQQDLKEEILKLTDGKGVDVAFEATSVNVVLDQLIDCLKLKGTLVVESIWSKKAEFDIHALVMKELTVRGIIGYAHDHEQTIKLVEDGKVDLKPFITGKIGFDGVVDEGFDTLINRNETAVKILVSPEL